jgi:isopentenyl phosphate kinase
MRVVKIGGSLLTNKSGYCEIDEASVLAIGRQLAELSGPSALNGLVLVIGGGSFGNGIPRRHGLDRPDSLDVRDVSRMTLGMFELMAGLIHVWRELGIAAYPVQASAVVHPVGDWFRIDAGTISRLCERNIIPVVTGDLIPSAHWPILSSDWIPVLIANECAVSSVAYLTDVEGVFEIEEGGAPPKLIKQVFQGDASRVLELAGASRQADVTGGMRTKVEAALMLSKMGIPSLICDGRSSNRLRDVVQGVVSHGTYFVPEIEMDMAS